MQHPIDLCVRVAFYLLVVSTIPYLVSPYQPLALTVSFSDVLRNLGSFIKTQKKIIMLSRVLRTMDNGHSDEATHEPLGTRDWTIV